MSLDASNPGDHTDKRRACAAFEILYTFVDFLAAASCVAESILFLDEQLKRIGTWCFIVGSIPPSLKPTIRVVREITLAAMGDEKQLAKHMSSST